MKAYRKIVDGDQLAKVIDIPDEFKDQEVEIVILPLKGKKNDSETRKAKKARGLLRAYKNDKFIPVEKELGWEIAVKEKHEKS